MNLSLGRPAPRWAQAVRNRHIVLIDALLIAASAWISFDVRLETLFPTGFREAFLAYLLLSVCLRPAVLWALGVYRRYWLYADADDLFHLAVAVSLSSLGLAVLFLGVLVPLGLVRSFPRSVPVIDWLVCLMLMGGSRFILRQAGVASRRSAGAVGPATRTSVVIAGAGSAGTLIAREIGNNPGMGLEVAGFVDDDPAKVGSRVNGLEVLGTCADLPWLVLKHQVAQVIVAMPTAPGATLRQIRERCKEVGATVRTMPALHEIISGRVGLQAIREVQIEDLLRRDLVETDIQAVHGQLLGRRIAITGAGGSIGRELCRQIAAARPGLLVLIGHGENSIFEIEQELKRRFPTLATQAVIADIRNARQLEAIFARYRPQAVFHAAAHKHVPLMESNAMEAVTNNVLGTRNVVRAAERSGVERLVMISTDKAVRPLSVMGGTKRLAEWVVQAAARRTGRPFVAVRFGNVLNSRGSVIPLFRDQIRTGGPVTVTHEAMTRYFMTIPEAVQLVLQAGVIGRGGEVFVLDMGEPVKIVDLARDMIELSGLKPFEDIDIVFTGIRPGEKLHETLAYADEVLAPTSHGKILVTRNGCGAVVDGLEDELARLELLATECREIELRDALEAIMVGCRGPEPEEARAAPAPLDVPAGA